MKTIFSRRLTLLFLNLAPVFPPAAGGAQETADTALSGNIRIQTTTFKVTGPELPLSLLYRPLSGDEALFQKLAGMVADGGAELIADHHFTIASAPEDSPGKRQESPFSRTGKGHLESVKETPYPTEYAPQRQHREMVPQKFEFKNCGLSTSARFEMIPLGPHAVPASVGVRGVLSVEQIRGDQLVSWPVSLPGLPDGAGLDVPQFLTEKLHLNFRSADGLHHLISTTRRAEKTLAKNDDYCFVFAKAAPEIASLRGRGAAGLAGALRLHALTFQLPSETGRRLLQARQTGGGDRALFEGLLKLAGEQKAELCDHRTLLLDSLTPAPVLVLTPGRLESRPPSAKVETIEEFAYPTEYSPDFLPQSFEYENLGQTFEVYVEKSAATGRALLNIQIQSRLAPTLFVWPGSPVSAPQVRNPCFSRTGLAATVSVGSGGVYCLGAITLPPFFKDQQPGQSRMRITLLKVIGNDGEGAGVNRQPSGPDFPPQPEVSSEIISLNADDAAILKGLQGLPAEAEALLARLTASGDARSIGWCQVTGPVSTNPQIQAEVVTPIPTACDRSPAGLLRPCRFYFYELGTNLEVLSGSATKAVRLRHGNASLTQPGEVELAGAAERGALRDAPVPHEEARFRSRYPNAGLLDKPVRYELEASSPVDGLTPEAFQIVSLAPANVPSRHAEEGRWHAAVLRVRPQ